MGKKKEEKTFWESVTSITAEKRESEYGNPVRTHVGIARMWGVYLRNKYGLQIPLTPADAAAMMALLKISRISTMPPGADPGDTIEDIAGYAWVMREIQNVENHKI